MTQSFNLVPTWAAAAHIYTMVLQNGETVAARHDAQEAIVDMASKLDRANRVLKHLSAKVDIDDLIKDMDDE